MITDKIIDEWLNSQRMKRELKVKEGERLVIIRLKKDEMLGKLGELTFFCPGYLKLVWTPQHSIDKAEKLKKSPDYAKTAHKQPYTKQVEK